VNVTSVKPEQGELVQMRHACKSETLTACYPAGFNLSTFLKKGRIKPLYGKKFKNIRS
jgi:hypothetical protein